MLAQNKHTQTHTVHHLFFVENDNSHQTNHFKTVCRKEIEKVQKHGIINRQHLFTGKQCACVSLS